MNKRKVETIIDDCLYCPHVRLDNAEKLEWVCGQTQTVLKKDATGWMAIPGNCPLERVEEPKVTPTKEPVPELINPLE